VPPFAEEELIVSTPEVTSPPPSRARAVNLLKAPGLWAAPLITASVLLFLISIIYLGSIVNPTSHLHHLPVALVDQDRGLVVDGSHVDLGQEVAGAMTGSPELSRLLTLQPETLAQAESQMSLGDIYAAVVVPSGFTASVLSATKPATQVEATGPGPEIEMLTNPRLGGVGVSLASGAVGAAVPKISAKLAEEVITDDHLPAPSSEAARSQLSSFVTFTQESYRPLPDNGGLGLSAFYIALLTIMCGFLAGTIVNTSVDVALGYATTEVGPRWKQRRPVAVSRVQTLLTKWVIAAVLAPLLTALLLLAGVTVLHAYAPHVLLLWLYVSFAAMVVAEGTIFFMAWLGSLGQVVAMLVFIYLSLASSGGTIPVQALPGFYRFVSNFEPLRQVLGGVRAIVYFNAQGAAGLDHAWLMTAVGFVIWLVLGLVVTASYDKRGLDRIQSDLLAYINRVADEYIGGPEPAGSAPAEQGSASGAPK
jgi:YhgE/Pip-like protein